MQALSLLDDDVLIRPLHYQKDKRSGKEYIKREDEKKKKMKQDNLLHLRSTYSSTTSELHQRLHFTVDLGSVRFPTPPPTSSSDSGTQDIVYTLQTFTDGSGPSRQPPRHKAKKGEIEDATGLTQIVNQSGSASGRMDGHVYVDDFDDEDAGGAWRPAVSKSTHRKYLRRKAKWEHYSALAEQDMQQDLEADKAGGNMTENSTDDKGAKNDEDLSSVLKDTRLEEDSLKSLQEEASAETALSDGEDDIEAEGIDVASEAGETFEAYSMADDGSSEQSWSLRALHESSVACITGDFAMQNVILQMGLRLLAREGMQIRQLIRWILKCHACYTTTSDVEKLFCPKCSNGGTLHIVEVRISENGAVISARNPRITTQATKYSIPMPKSGRDGITKHMILREN
ncbi:unnamed protein product [Microthlaspi erraticum]|uniref:Nin one binding (NOB1) Zn-ribbon-like domain-containing protein n=1 Tax=Microthlaspi erraticum TaxID=1685480 RepID=A0A6D2IVH0_9BRAS|nr:unnamed protein product [Microthlaspi erraticum]